MPPVPPAENQQPAKVAAKVEQAMEFTKSTELEATLRQLPDVRQEMVERASKLVESSSYPPPEMIRRLARLFAQPGQVDME